MKELLTYSTSLQELLFNDNTPLAFAEEAATGQIMHEIDDDDGAIKAAIDTSIFDVFDAWRDELGIAASNTINGIIDGFSDFFSGLGGNGGGGSTTDISGLADRFLSNLEETTTINQPLTFVSQENTVGASDSNSLGYDEDNNMYLKARAPGRSLFLQLQGLTHLENF